MSDEQLIQLMLMMDKHAEIVKKLAQLSDNLNERLYALEKVHEDRIILGQGKPRHI